MFLLPERFLDFLGWTSWFKTKRNLENFQLNFPRTRIFSGIVRKSNHPKQNWNEIFFNSRVGVFEISQNCIKLFFGKFCFLQQNNDLSSSRKYFSSRSCKTSSNFKTLRLNRNRVLMSINLCLCFDISSLVYRKLLCCFDFHFLLFAVCYDKWLFIWTFGDSWSDMYVNLWFVCCELLINE